MHRQDFENKLIINYQKRDRLTQNCKQRPVFSCASALRCRTYITRATDFKILGITLWSDYATLKACKRPQMPPGTTYTLSEAVEKRFSGNTPFARCLRLKYREPNKSTASFACNRSSIEKTK